MDELTRMARRAAAGDDDALGQLVSGSYDAVWRLCAALVDAASADDLAQESFLRVVRALPGFEGRSAARTWVLAIARNTCMDELRRRTRRRRAAHATTRLQFRPHVPDTAEQVAAGDLLTALSPERRAAFVVTQVLGLSYEEAAVVCGCPVGTIRSRVARARSDMVAMWEEAEQRARRH